VFVQVTVNVSLIRVKLLWAVNGNPDPYSYSCLCERSLMVGNCSCQYRQIVAQTDLFGPKVGGFLALVLHSSNKLGELSHWAIAILTA